MAADTSGTQGVHDHITVLNEGAEGKVAFQGFHGAYSDMACRAVFPKMATLPCPTFQHTFAAVVDGRARYAMIPIDNSIAGRVADIHHLIPDSGLHIIGEHFQRVDHRLLAPKGAKFEDIVSVRSHVHALPQCRKYLHENGLEIIVHADTAGAAAEIAELNDPTQAAIASSLAAEIYDLQVMADDVQDSEHNITRFLIMAQEPLHPDPDDGPVITSFVFRVRSMPAALYKALGGFATNGVNMTKLESYILDERFTVAQFYADIEGHTESRAVQLAFEELSFFSREVRILGVYPASPFRGS